MRLARGAPCFNGLIAGTCFWGKADFARCDMSSEHSVVLVTGGSRGIGRGIALHLAREGWNVALNFSQNIEKAEEVKKKVIEAGRQCLTLQGDVGSSQARRSILEGIHRGFGRLDLFISNAGIAPRVRNDLLETTEESFDEVLSTNLRGPFFLAQSAARWMLKQKQDQPELIPRMIFITSISSYVASVNRGEYCISKAGLSMTAQLFAARLAADGIPVFEVRPGIIQTDMTAKVASRYDSLIAGGLVPQRRWGTPEDVAHAVAAIARGDLDYSTGQVIEVGGGFGLRSL